MSVELRSIRHCHVIAQKTELSLNEKYLHHLLPLSGIYQFLPAASRHNVKAQDGCTTHAPTTYDK